MAGLSAADGETDLPGRLLALAGPPRAVAAGERVTVPGDAPAALVILEGWAGTMVRIDADRRQLADLLLPGDAWLPLGHGYAGEGLVALTPLVAASVPAGALREAGRASPDLLWRAATFVAAQNARLVQQVARNGRRTARERVAHLLLELYERLRIKGQAADGAFDLPVGQSVIADMVGLSYVHVSRVLTHLERSGMIERTRTTVALRDRSALDVLCGFDAAYLGRASESGGAVPQ